MVAIDLLLRAGKIRIGKGPDSNSHEARLSPRQPNDAVAAIGTKPKVDRMAAVRWPAVFRCFAFDFDVLFIEEGRNSIRAARSSLTFEAMAKRNKKGLSLASCAKLAAGTCRDAGNHRRNIPE
jgi:hypothetical protein